MRTMYTSLDSNRNSICQFSRVFLFFVALMCTDPQLERSCVVCATLPIDRPVNICSCSVRALTSPFSDITHICLVRSAITFSFLLVLEFLFLYLLVSCLIEQTNRYVRPLEWRSPSIHSVQTHTQTPRAMFWYLIRYSSMALCADAHDRCHLVIPMPFSLMLWTNQL